MKNRFYQIMAIGALCLSAAALAVVLWTSARAQDAAPEAALAIPPTLNYQGHLRDPDGSLTTGTYDITARIYDIASGGDPLYTTILPGVNVRDGLFNIVLGDDPENPLSSVFANAPLYIGIALDSNPELIPRQRLHAVPWAFQASTLINNAVAQTVQGLTSNGDVIVNGDTTSTGSFTVNGDTTSNGDVTVNGSLDSDSLNVAGGGLIVDSGGTTITEISEIMSKPVQIIRFENMNTTPNNDDDYDTHVDAENWYCVATGFSMRLNIDGDTGNYVVWTFVDDVTNTWHASVQFPSETTHENPDLDVLCFHKSIIQWIGDEHLIDPTSG